MRRNIKAIIQYDGTDYCGFQSQVRQGSPTIQETIEAALTRLLGESITIYGSGRTDSGVHALAQVINFYTTSNIPLERLTATVNHLLPLDIVFLAAEEAEETFHARKCALGKYYEYRVLNNRVPTAIGSRYFYQYPYMLDESLVRQGCKLLEGTHNFKSFSASGSSVKSFERTIGGCFAFMARDFCAIWCGLWSARFWILVMAAGKQTVLRKPSSAKTGDWPEKQPPPKDYF